MKVLSAKTASHLKSLLSHGSTSIDVANPIHVRQQTAFVTRGAETDSFPMYSGTVRLFKASDRTWVDQPGLAYLLAADASELVEGTAYLSLRFGEFEGRPVYVTWTAPVIEAGCGLTKEGNVISLTDTIAGDGLQIDEDCVLSAKVSCGVTIDETTKAIRLDPSIAGAHLSFTPSCTLDVIPVPQVPEVLGCGLIRGLSGEIRLNPTIAGNFLSLSPLCVLDVIPPAVGCGLVYDTGVIRISPTLPGNRLSLTPLCVLNHVDEPVSCGLERTDTLHVASTLAGNGLEFVDDESGCHINARTSCGLKIGLDNAIQIDPEALGDRLILEEDPCLLQVVDEPVSCGILRDEFGLRINPSLPGHGLILSEEGGSCILDVLVGCGLKYDELDGIAFEAVDVYNFGLINEGSCQLKVYTPDFQLPLKIIYKDTGGSPILFLANPQQWNGTGWENRAGFSIPFTVRNGRGGDLKIGEVYLGGMIDGLWFVWHDLPCCSPYERELWSSGMLLMSGTTYHYYQHPIHLEPSGIVLMSGTTAVSYYHPTVTELFPIGTLNLAGTTAVTYTDMTPVTTTCCASNPIPKIMKAAVSGGSGGCAGSAVDITLTYSPSPPVWAGTGTFAGHATTISWKCATSGTNCNFMKLDLTVDGCFAGGNIAPVGCDCALQHFVYEGGDIDVFISVP